MTLKSTFLVVDHSTLNFQKRTINASFISMKTMTEDRINQTLKDLYHQNFLDLVYQAASIHRQFQDPGKVQMCTLLSVKTGGCQEDCAYCPQAARYHTNVKRSPLLDVDEVLENAKAAKEGGSTRFCMGAAWREVKDNAEFDAVLDMVKGVKDLGLEACCTLGMLTENQAQRLADAGLTAYNHNLDSSESFYGDIIKTRSYQDRLNTIQNVSKAGISVCCGGIVGMGESHEDRIAFLETLLSLNPAPESIPINALTPVEGTPLANQELIDPFDWIRVIAVARIKFPHARIRLSAGRLSMSDEAQALAFMAGANSIFTGEKLLTTGNPDHETDQQLLKKCGLKAFT